MIWQKYRADEKLAILQAVASDKGIVEQAVEKDWWVTAVLKALLNTSWGNGTLLFKGGTSLSKGWNLIERFSEDIDLIVDRKFFKIPDQTKQQRTKIRKATHKYIQGTLIAELDLQLKVLGVTGYEIEFASTNSSGMVTEVNVRYESILGSTINYIMPQIKMEFSCMAMKDPYEVINLNTLIHGYFDAVDEELSVDFPTVIPGRTFLEKIFLLNEEFQRGNPRSVRMARHLYDIEKIMETSHAADILKDTNLYIEIVKHRKDFYEMDSVDYNKHHPLHIDFCPPESCIKDWENDYNELCKTFIYGNALTFDELIVQIKSLITSIRTIEMESPIIKEENE